MTHLLESWHKLLLLQLSTVQHGLYETWCTQWLISKVNKSSFNIVPTVSSRPWLAANRCKIEQVFLECLMIFRHLLAYLTREHHIFIRSVQTAVWIEQGDTLWGAEGFWASQHTSLACDPCALIRSLLIWFAWIVVI